MKSLPNWLHWIFFYIGIGYIFHIARAGDIYAQAAIPAIIVLRSLAMIVVAFAMNSAWYQPRSTTLLAVRSTAEILILLGLLANGNNVAAILSILTMLLYEFARTRVSYQA